MDKATLRQQFLQRRLNIPRSRYWILTDQIVDQVKLINWVDFKMVHIFLPISMQNEIDTFSILLYFKHSHPNLQIVVPRTNFKSLEMLNMLYDHEHTILGRNRYGIPEPIHGRVVPPAEIDLVFIPLLAFDRNGNRAGYGKGFYDRFLSNCRPDVKKIGLSFFDPVDEISDINEFDVPLDMCLTPGKTWKFGN
ncbi:MAG: 5-formyltetrahydrofolate cyclo-ligase [Daejeonella sp.]|uniref:5-formyltetrahydrofolate cyclo-ligase n=1 Tax=Daejeonella sp. JGW-45 TaxID=3034148 RepID=UPI0023EB4501|nr:5-formyltetrahydrofolate cyclo-ligase [Daejeonella sp. JGW-45]